ncbi:MAG: molybdopterin-dependent oxidoreductase, partial [Rhodospirillales bacterium]|nr:molybdopterin-dependent oxidoreductase [Rhodospirillales bacterium]
MNVIGPESKPSPQAATQAEDDVWVPSSCSLCYGSCSLLAHRVDGVVVKIEGNPESAIGKGRLCGKGVSGLLVHYDPHRLTKPLRRTNPEKGIGIDPGFKEISWEEAISEIVDNLKRIRADDPRKLVLERTTTVIANKVPFMSFAAGFGTNNQSTAGGGLHCGNGAHLISGIMHASWGVVPDFEYCNYAMYFGASKGHSAGHASNSNMMKAADARTRGMKLVVVDPMANFAAAKSTEWVPLRVGTDAALALSMCNVIANDLGMLDLPYLRAKTNGSYLIGPDGGYLREADTDKPMVWDEAAGKAVTFDETDAGNMALDGSYDVDGVSCQPSFALLREHLKIYTPEHSKEISTIPASDIRRLATEFATEARIGSNIVLDGVEVPYRPAAAIAFRGNQGHVNSTYNMLAVDLLNQLVGSADMVGGCLGFNPACHGYPETGRLRYVPNPDPDGMMISGTWMSPHFPYPINKPHEKTRTGLQNLFPMSMGSMFYNSADQEEVWSKFDLPYRPEMLINMGTNLVMSIGNKETVAEALKKYKMIVSFDLFVNESTQFSDIVLPDCDYLQSLGARAAYPFI